MTVQETESIVKHCYSTWSKSYYDDYYGEAASYPPVHRDLMKSILVDAGVETLLDAGCGPASFLRDLMDTPMALYGFDLTPEMVAEGQRVFAASGRPADRIREGSVLSAEAYSFDDAAVQDGFDATVCVGVIPHIPESLDSEVMRRLHDSVKPGGLVILEARNQLFSLFTSNRYSYEFMTQELIQQGALDASANGESTKLQDALAEYQTQFRMDLPPVRRGHADEPGYDEVLSRTHNPLLVQRQFAEVGFVDVELLFYHFHCLPPMFEAKFPEWFRQQSLAMEDPRDWRGHFMASAFLVTGRRR